MSYLSKVRKIVIKLNYYNHNIENVNMTLLFDNINFFKRLYAV